ncbi:hypothetical protein [Tomitella gaofuii]|uniref:hypothetical protein n=1 Tax=Tomitella gaofuii TaxID=2760083 RepID=UPI0015FE2D55|nr:hypothetical protein [Tomitella gaofuii]
MINSYSSNKNAVQADKAVSEARHKEDSTGMPAEVQFIAPDRGPTNPWPGWVSADKLQVPSGSPSNYIPSHGTVIHVGRPTMFTKGGVTYRDYAQLGITFDLKGVTNYPVKLTSLEAVVMSQTPAPDGTVYCVYPQGSSLRGDIVFDLSVGADHNAFSTEYGTDMLDRYLDNHVVTIDRSEYIGFNAIAFTPPDTDTTFLIRACFDTMKCVNVDDNGVPFRLVSYPTATDNAFVTAYPQGSGIDAMGIYPCRYPSECASSMNSIIRNPVPN